MMNTLSRICIMVCLIGWTGNYLFENSGQALAGPAKKAKYTKCIGQDGSVYFGKIPAGVICQSAETAKTGIKPAADTKDQDQSQNQTQTQESETQQQPHTQTEPQPKQQIQQ